MSNGTRTIQVRMSIDLKTCGTWESCPAIDFKVTDTDEASDAQAQKVANKFHCQVRWNKLGLFQGHYVEPVAANG